jgi:hypothetical protein
MHVACSHKNLIVNSDFRSRIAPWTGRSIQRVPNPENRQDHSILMGRRDGKTTSTLSQTISLKPEYHCAYYLTFRLYNLSPKGQPAQFYAAVSYLDQRSRQIRITPLLVEPPKQKAFRSYYTIVPPPPRQTAMIKVVFLLTQGLLLIDLIRLTSHQV